ncbi:unnamed protein product [Allacma fusca]|uniref:Uncharacterized protein n=1 Tax=Allacma fusca TaxID=39272 RepID=A0A8J2NWZ8_9HEXA|nr:unnamed protein product [Allacma fusca]
MFRIAQLASLCPRVTRVTAGRFNATVPRVVVGNRNIEIRNSLNSRWWSSGVTASPGISPIPSPAVADPSPKEEVPPPKKLTLKEKTRIYLRSMYRDYSDVYFETIADAKAKPVKAAFYLFLLGGVLYCIWSNPDERDYFHTFVGNRESLELCAASIRNPDSEAFVNEVSRLWIKGLLRHQSLGLFSIIWKHNEDPALGVYNAQCDYLKPLYSEMWERLVDVGFCGHWWILEEKMIDYDINHTEWESQEVGKTGVENSSPAISSMLTPK